MLVPIRQFIDVGPGDPWDRDEALQDFVKRHGKLIYRQKVVRCQRVAVKRRSAAAPGEFEEGIHQISIVTPNVRANLTVEASAVSPVRDGAPCAADLAYGACRSGSG